MREPGKSVAGVLYAIGEQLAGDPMRPWESGLGGGLVGLLHDFRGTRLVCTRCRKEGDITDVLLAPRREVFDVVRRFIEAHKHEAKPLTAEQREQARVVGLRRRGALRCGSGSGR